ncbi:MAG: pyridoxamine 5'-phosphate oxidase family protein, partial [Rhizobiaceae bacterium]
MDTFASDQFSPFHEGERAIQEQLGVQDIEAWARKVVRSYLPDQHRAFYCSLPFLVVAARDGKGRPWATVLEGSEGFVTSGDPQQLTIHSGPPIGDALVGALGTNSDIGILGIEFDTRRRNRINGRVKENKNDGIEIFVDQTFGNCPQYIRERNWYRVDVNVPGVRKRRKRLSREQQNWIEIADTFFIATGYRGEGENPAFGMDASHRGGEKGFVRAISDTKLIYPDYAGNNHYNTIGNLLLDNKVGMLFVDFTTGSLLQLTGNASIDWNSSKIEQYPGAQR